MGVGCCRRSAVQAVLDYPERPKPEGKVRHDAINSEDEQSLMELSSPRSGRKIQWNRLTLLGQGSYAKVYLCENVDTGQKFAVKHFKLSPSISKAKKEFELMQREIALLRTLDHPNIVQYYQTDLSASFDSFDVLIEYVPGKSLKDLITEEKNLDEKTIKEYTAQLLEGLRYLHSVGVIHRDLKPANVLITPNGRVKLVDFGSSRKFDIHDTEISNSLKGSPYWMAPEVVLKRGHSYACDVWAIGCLIIQMVSGKPPWSDLSNRAHEVMDLIATPESYPVIPECSHTLKALIYLCLQRNPEKRPTVEALSKQSFFIDS